MAIDITDYVIKYFTDNFVGKQVSEDHLEIDRHVNNLGIGDRTNASGSARIVAAADHNGKIEKEKIFDGYGYKAELNVSFRYESQTSAEKYSIPGGALIDHPWGSLHPTGEIEFHIHAGQDSNWTVEITRMTFDTGDDRPNSFIRDHVAVKFRGIMEELLQEAANSSPDA
ncbi:hypothetical protein P4278_10025 [Bacillus thuringiensis]|nr:hypothetical protein [Bacillus thuringiensis]MED2759079.1 hypothetical protein [Bacillus thuringiensis]MED2771304.1 hypothetical protein [Bacillus thuringiensis]MED2777832.1 hypothetical protein [Bacillus thuringiensis]MED2780037.1 hypothetical protein [Bacillus thuringiensis]